EAVRTEPLTLGGITYPATVVQTTSPVGNTTTWQDKDGRTLKMQALLGLTMLRETKEEALSLPSEKYEPPADLGKAMAVDAGRTLDDPRNASLLKIRLTSPALASPVIDDRQKVARVDANTVDLTITAAPLKPEGSLTISTAAKREPEWVKPGPYLQSDRPELIAQARQILKGETNAFWAAQKIRDWVHANMAVKGDIGIVRSGMDVLNDRQGVCRDFAVLYVSLARAAGIPSRIATGLVYNEGAFYYHAWAESYAGRWIDLDPTLPTAFVDATHIKLGHGPAESMLTVGKVMGNLKAQILDYKTVD
ncbi:MAG: transglutaminase-like domain-containing protein, partial [Armatimonadetes bacterium]|nr:transglutaminase-like domain-containing protein [Armatimonadota bacterium]